MPGRPPAGYPCQGAAPPRTSPTPQAQHGLVVAPLGIAAAIGLILLMAGAVAVHLRAKEAFATAVPALVLGLVTVAVLVLRITTV